MLPLRARVDLAAMAMKGCSAFPKAPALLEPHHQIVWCQIQDTHWVKESYPSAEVQSVYSIAPADWVNLQVLPHGIRMNLGAKWIFLWQPQLIYFHTVQWFQILSSNSNCSIYSHLDVFKFSKLLNYLVHWWDLNRYYHSGSEWTWK